MSLRVAFFGTPDFAVPTLDALIASTHDVVAVVTQPDRPRGRGQQLHPSPVKARAVAAGVPVLQPDRMKDEAFLATLHSLDLDLGVVAAYGKILPQRLLDLPRLGMINVHASLLPRWRGAAPIHRAVIAGDAVTGVTIMRVVLALDAGPMMATVTDAIGPNDTSVEVERRLATSGARALVDTVDALARGPVTETPQEEQLVTYAARIEKRETRVDFAQPATVVHNLIRGLQPWPLVSAMLNGKRLLLLESRVADASSSAPQSGAAPAVGDSPAPGTIVEAGPEGLVVATQPGSIRLLRVQLEGRPPVDVRSFINGHRVEPGHMLTPVPALP